MSEKLTQTLKTVGKIALVGGIIYEASNLAFSTKTRKEIGKRDNWTCQVEGCDDGTGEAKSFKKGWMVFAGHEKTHDRTDPKYDDAESGRIHCIEHETEFHEQLLEEAKKKGNRREIAHNEAALKKLKRVDHHTWDYREHPEKYGTDVTEEIDELKKTIKKRDDSKLKQLRMQLDSIIKKR